MTQVEVEVNGEFMEVVNTFKYFCSCDSGLQEE